MRTLIALLALSAAIPVAAQQQACKLTAQDYDALAVSDSKLTPEGVRALAPDALKELCDTRAFARQVMKTPAAVREIPDYNTDYVSDAEFERITTVQNAIIARKLRQKPN